MVEPGTCRQLVSNFADERVGGVAANVVRVVCEAGRPVVRGEGLYWRAERLLKRLEDRVAVSSRPAVITRCAVGCPPHRHRQERTTS